MTQPGDRQSSPFGLARTRACKDVALSVGRDLLLIVPGFLIGERGPQLVVERGRWELVDLLQRGRPVTLRCHEPASEASIDLEGPDPDASA